MIIVQHVQKNQDLNVLLVNNLIIWIRQQKLVLPIAHLYTKKRVVDYVSVIVYPNFIKYNLSTNAFLLALKINVIYFNKYILFTLTNYLLNFKINFC